LLSEVKYFQPIDESMDSLILEKINGGILYLYTSMSEKDFYNHLELFLAELFRNPKFSILIPAEREGLFYHEYLSGETLPDFEKLRLESSILLKILKEGRDRECRGERIAIPWEGEELPVVQVKIICSGEGKLGLMVFHNEMVLLDSEDMRGLEGYVFDHIFSAYQGILERDTLLARLEENEAKLDAIREISDLLGQLNLDTLLSHLIAVCTRLTGAQVGCVVLEGNFTAEAEWGLSRAVLEKIRMRGGPSLSSLVMETRQPLLIRGYSESSELEPVEDSLIESYLCVPLVSKERVLGTVNLVNADSSKGGVFNETDKTAIVTISSLAATAIENAILHRDSIEKERMTANLQIARSIQRGMYPVEALEIPGYEMAWLTKSCDETGGDYFDFMALGEGRAAFAIGDVSGHGIGAALLMATGRANLRALLSVKSDLKEVMDRLNCLLEEDMDTEKFMTMFLGSIDHREHTITYVNAGHDQPLFFQARQSRVHELESTGLPLGMMPDWSYDLGAQEQVFPGDVLLLSTDGVWEATRANGEQFGKRRLQASLARHALGAASEVIEGILKDVEAHTQGLVHPDDMTLVVIKRK